MATDKDQPYIDQLVGMESAEEDASAIVKVARQIAREEIASLCGLIMRRVQDSMSPISGTSLPTALISAFGEALHDFGGTEEKPGE